MNSPVQFSRNFDYFRVSQSKERVGISENTIRSWAKLKDGPRIIRMIGIDMTWMRYSDLERFIFEHSEEVKPALAEVKEAA